MCGLGVIGLTEGVIEGGEIGMILGLALAVGVGEQSDGSHVRMISGPLMPMQCATPACSSPFPSDRHTCFFAEQTV